MKIKFDDIKSDSFKHWFIIHAVTKLSDAKYNESFKNHHENGGIMELDFRINGIEIDPFAVIDGIEAQMDNMVEKRAKELIGDKLNTALEDIETYCNEAKVLRHGLYSKLGFKYDEYDE